LYVYLSTPVNAKINMKKRASAPGAKAADGAKAKISLVQKMMDDKKAIYQFFKGEISSDIIDARGIKFVKAV
jgi:hypothetical protein